MPNTFRIGLFVLGVLESIATQRAESAGNLIAILLTTAKYIPYTFVALHLRVCRYQKARCVVIKRVYH